MKGKGKGNGLGMDLVGGEGGEVVEEGVVEEEVALVDGEGEDGGGAAFEGEDEVVGGTEDGDAVVRAGGSLHQDCHSSRVKHHQVGHLSLFPLLHTWSAHSWLCLVLEHLLPTLRLPLRPLLLRHHH